MIPAFQKEQKDLILLDVETHFSPELQDSVLSLDLSRQLVT